MMRQRCLLLLLSLLALGAATQELERRNTTPSRVVPCSRRSLLVSGLHLTSFSRFALVDDMEPPPNNNALAMCELSREMLVRILDSAKMKRLNGPLPSDFFENRSVMETGVLMTVTSFLSTEARGR